MHPGALALLRCPRCGATLEQPDPHALRCAAGHAFDVARQGYAGLLEGAVAKHAEDTPDMVAAREAFLGAGHFEPLTAALADAAVDAARGVRGGVVDVGAGTAHHTAAVMDALGTARSGVALDLSRAALRRATRAHPRLGAARCDAWASLPVGDGVAALALCVFAPRDAAELRRVLGPGGALLVVTPRADHLAELRDQLGLLGVQEDKDARLERTLARVGELEDERAVRATMSLSRTDALALATMGPAARHTSAEELAERAARLPAEVAVTLAARVTTTRRSA